jgi:hypothetical protein
MGELVLGDRIAQIAASGLRRERGGFPTLPGWCLGFAFEAVARAQNTNRWVLYGLILDRTGVDGDRSRWANDSERGIIRLGWAATQQDLDPKIAEQYKKLLQLLQPGDLLFSSTLGDEAPRSRRTARDKEGHIGIYLGSTDATGKPDPTGTPRVAENTRAHRGQFFGKPSALRLTLLEHWDTVTTIGRIPNTSPS